MAGGEWRYGGLGGGAMGDDPYIYLITPAGQVRKATLTRSDVMKILRSAVTTLEWMDRITNTQEKA